MYKVYSQALQNEIYVDEVAFVETELSKFVNYNVIRPYITQKYIKKYPLLFKYLFNIISKTWIFWNTLIHTFLFLKHISKKTITKSKLIYDSKLILAATPRLFDQLEKVKNQSDLPSNGLVIGKRVKVRSCRSYFTIDEVCSYNDIFKAYKHSLLSPIKLNSILKGTNNLQTYNAFDWFLIYNYLDRQNQIQEVWFGNHFDRWAVLFDNLSIKTKIIVQHGIENGNLTPPILLSTISKVHLIRINQKEYFIGKIIKNEFEFEELISKIQFVDVFLKDRLRVLIVGNCALYSEEESILVKSLSKMQLYFCLKPHPVLSQVFYAELKKKTEFLLLSERDVFPDVDLVISYESTLGLEYEIEGVEVLYYADYKVEEIIQNIQNRIKLEI